MESYTIPYYQKAKFSVFLNFIFIFTSIMFGIGAGFCLIVMTKEQLIVGLLAGLFLLGLTIFFGYMIIFVLVLKKGYIEITSEYLEASVPFGTFRAYWKEIYEFGVFEYNNNTMLGILLEKDRYKKRKRTIGSNFNSLNGIPTCSFQISLMFFKGINIEKLLLTMEEQINKFPLDDNVTLEEMIEDNKEVENNIFKAILGSVILCIFISIVYGFSIHKLNTNYVVIPIFSSMIIISVFNKYYIEKVFSLGVRLFLGFLCLVQIPIAVVEQVMLTANIEFTISNILDITVDYFQYLIDYPSEQIAVIIAAIICFGMGLLAGRVGRETR